MATSTSAPTVHTATRGGRGERVHITAANCARCTVHSVSTVQRSPTTTTPSQVVSTEGGPVTLQELAPLKAKLVQIRQQAAEKQDESTSFTTLIDDRLTEIGTLLLDHADWWSPDERSRALLAKAADLRSRIASDESGITDLSSNPHSGLGGAIGKVRDWNATRKLTAEKSTLEAQLRPVLMEIGQASSAADIKNLEPVREQARSAEAQCQEIRAEAESLNADASRIQDEIRRREESVKEMGFDALYTAAYLRTFGAPGVASPLNLKRGEQAVLSVPAKLARNQTRTRYVGGTQGFSFPIGHTGIRYRVGSYHGTPVQQQVLTTLDMGTLVVTNQRIAFIGRTKTVSADLAKLVNIQCYSDALAVFHEGRENADYFFVDQPRYVLFMVNWASQTAR